MQIIKFIKAFLSKAKFKKLSFKAIGENVYFAEGWNIINAENITIDNNVYIGPYSTIYGHGGIIIKEGVIIGPKITIYSANHNFKENLTYIPYDSKLIKKTVIINENVWIGGNVILLPGVVIGEGAIIAAGSVVSKNVCSHEIFGGNPAKRIGERDINVYNKLKKEGRIYLKFKHGKQ